MFKNERERTIYTSEDQAPAELAHETERSRSRIKHKKLLVASLATVITIAAACFIRDSILYEHTDDAQIDGHITPVSARINGQVQQVNVIEGQRVDAGDVLAVIDQKEYSIAVYQAMANVAYAENTAASLYFNAAITIISAYGGLNSAQAVRKNVAAEVAAAEHRLRADEAVLTQAEANATETDSDIGRDEDFTRREDASRQQDDSATAAEKANDVQVKSAEAVVAADQQALLQAKVKLLQATTNLRNAQTAPQQVSVAKVKAQAADSQIMERKAQAEQARLNLSYTIICSPVTGIISKRRIEVGQNVSVGQELIDVVSLDDVWITANFKETQLSRLKPGQPVVIKVDAYGRRWKGHLTSLGAAASSVFRGVSSDAIANHVRVQRIPVRIDFDRPQSRDFNAEGLLKPGLSVEPEVRVRWLPHASNRLPDSRKSTLGPTAC